MAVEPHKHCPICGSPIPLNELVCSPDCQKVWDARLTKRKKSKITQLLFSLFTLELNILADIKYIMNKYGVKATEVMQISVSKTNKDSVFVAQPSPWMITGEPI